MLNELARGLVVVREGNELVPTWRIMTPGGDYLILTRFDPDEPDQRDRMLTLVPLFMAWKVATAFVLTEDTWLGPERTRSGEEAADHDRRFADRTIGCHPAHSPHTGTRLYAAGVASVRCP